MPFPAVLALAFPVLWLAGLPLYTGRLVLPVR
jgi:hypothetical protein